MPMQKTQLPKVGELYRVKRGSERTGLAPIGFMGIAGEPLNLPSNQRLEFRIRKLPADIPEGILYVDEKVYYDPEGNLGNSSLYPGFMRADGKHLANFHEVKDLEAECIGIGPIVELSDGGMPGGV